MKPSGKSKAKGGWTPSLRGSAPTGAPPRRKNATAPPPAPKQGPQKQKKQQQQKKDVATLNAFDPRPIPARLAGGHAFHTHGKVRFPLSTDGTVTRAIFWTNTGQSGTVALVINPVGTVPSIGVYTIPTLASSATDGGPTAARALKTTCRITNITQRVNQGGTVFVGELDQRLSLPDNPSTMTSAQWQAVLEGIMGLSAAKAVDGLEFARSLERSVGIADSADYEGFNNFFGTQSLDNFASHWSVFPGSAHMQRPMTTRFAIFSPTSVVNSYMVEVKAQFYTRWPTGHLLADHMKPIITVSPSPPKGDGPSVP